MAKLSRKVGATSQIFQIFIQDSSSLTGAGLTGLTNSSSGLTAYYHRDTDTTATAINLVSMTVGTFTSSGFKEIDATNMPGWYQFCPPNAALASGASVAFHLKGATNMAPLPIEVDLDAQADITAVDGQLTSGNNATLNLKQLNIVNSAGDAIVASSTGSNGQGINASGNGTGDGLKCTGGSTGSGIHGLSGTGATGDGMALAAQSTTGRGFTSVGSGSGAGAIIQGGTTGTGILFNGGGTSGIGLRVVTTSGNAVSLEPVAGHGINIQAGTAKNGIVCAGATSGAGLRLVAGTTGNAFELVAGSTSGDGINITTTVGHGANITATGTSKHGVLITGGTAGTSDGLKCVAGTGGVPIRGDITANITGSVSGSVGSVTAGVTVTTNNDKTGYSLTVTPPTSADIATAIWTDLLASSDFSTASSVGKLIKDDVDATISSRSTYAGGAVASVTGNVGGNVAGSVGSVTADVGITQTAADKVWSTTARVLTAGTNIVLAKGVGITGFNDIAASSIVSAGAITTSGGKVSGVILTDTITTYTGNTPQTGDAYARIGANGAGLTEVQLDLTEAVPTTNTDNTLGDCLNAARCQGFGKWVLSGTTLTLYAPDGTTAVRTFTLDSATSPTSRT